MIISAYSDGEMEDKIAEFYDTTYPCSFFRGLLTEAQEQEKEVEITFTARQEYKPAKEFDRRLTSYPENIEIKSFYSDELIDKAKEMVGVKHE